MSAILAALLPQLLPVVSSLVVAGIGWLTLTIQNKVKADTAWKKLAEIGVGLVGKSWDRLGPEVQTALADGKVTAEERAVIEKAALDVLTAEDEAVLTGIGKAVGVRFAAIIAKLAGNFIETWAKAHDPFNPTVSKLAFPVQPFEEIPDTASGG
jgi:hypothetical protein